MTAQDLSLDFAAIRADFPVLHQDHNPGVPLVFLDNAASSQKPRQVIEAMDDYYRRYHANVHRGIHKLSEAATAAYEDARKKIRRFINATSKREIIYTRGTTESINLVAQTWGRANLKAGDVVISTGMEHHANIVPWQMLAMEKGFVVKYVPVLPDGTLDQDAYAALLRDNPVKLVTFMHVSNVLGTVNPAREMIAKAHEAGALALLDSAQSVPHMPVDVQALDADFVAFSGHKMLGPTGIGILYSKRDLLDAMPPWQGGGDMIATVTLDGSTWNDLPYKFEAGTPAIAEAIGLGVAIDYLSNIGMANVQAYEHHLAKYLHERLAEVPGLRVFGPETADRGAVAAFEFAGVHPHDLAQLLDEKGVAARAGHHCAQPLHDHYGVNATTRASLYIYNSTDEIDKLIKALELIRRTFNRPSKH